jgi:hypothetical protein
MVRDYTKTSSDSNDSKGFFSATPEWFEPSASYTGSLMSNV